MGDFDERSEVVRSVTPWGSWHQTVELVCVEVALEPAKGKPRVAIGTQRLGVEVGGQVLFDAQLWAAVQVDESTWTVEDSGRLLAIQLCKASPGADRGWRGLFKDSCLLDALEWDRTQQRLTLERCQREHPGFDFANAEIDGNYQGGGPRLSS